MDPRSRSHSHSHSDCALCNIQVYQTSQRTFIKNNTTLLQKPFEFKNKILALKDFNESGFHKQACET
jgi:hypothetical protein